MSRITDTLPTEVNIGDCRCGPDVHPDGDVVYLRPHLSLTGGLAAVAALSQPGTPMELQERLSKALVVHGIVGWNFVDDDGKPIPVTAETIEAALPWKAGGLEIANRAADLYAEDLNSPLAVKNGKSSQRGQTNGSTSRRPSKTSRIR